MPVLPISYLEVSVDDSMILAVGNTLQYLLNTVAACGHTQHYDTPDKMMLNM